MNRAWTAGLLLLMACGGGAAPPPAAAPTSPVGTPPSPGATPQGQAARGSPEAAKSDPFALPEGPRDDDPVTPEPPALPLDAWLQVAKVKGVAAPPAACAAFAQRAPAPAKDLPSALAEADVAKRDAMLAWLESRTKSDGGALRALRADLAPVECADVIVDPYLTTLKTAATGRVGHTLVGLSLAAKLARTALTPPFLDKGADKTADKAKVVAFVKGPLKTWVVEQATAIESLASGAAGLSGYGRGVAAIEAGSADLRLVDKIRSSPVPAGWDAELKQVYEAALDEALEPRKARGRDAALVGMGDFARLGSLHDARVDRARGMLAKLYGGRRIDALDELLLAPAAPPPPSATSPGERAMATVPVFWTDRATWAPSAASALAPALARGIPEAMRAAARSDGPPSGLGYVYARARFDMGRLYWRRVDFVEAAYAAKAGSSADDRLLLAVSLALANGPRSAAEMMRAASPSAFGLDHTDALDALVAEQGPLAGMAAFDAAHLRSLCVPEGAAAVTHLGDVAARFRKAASLLSDPTQKKRAEQRAADADAAAASSLDMAKR